jgi:CubicO group peptidase (beta-lactamase class C family)
MADLELQVPLTTDNVFEIGSITKQFTAVAILMLEEQGKLKVEDEITKYIPTIQHWAKPSPSIIY